MLPWWEAVRRRRLPFHRPAGRARCPAAALPLPRPKMAAEVDFGDSELFEQLDVDEPATAAQPVHLRFEEADEELRQQLRECEETVRQLQAENILTGPGRGPSPGRFLPLCLTPVMVPSVRVGERQLPRDPRAARQRPRPNLGPASPFVLLRECL